jgi:hypothetical protein
MRPTIYASGTGNSTQGGVTFSNGTPGAKSGKRKCWIPQKINVPATITRPTDMRPETALKDFRIEKGIILLMLVMPQ